MTEMIERVASALKDRLKQNSLDRDAVDFSGLAQIAIEAMHEPTDDMLEAAWVATTSASPDERMAMALAAPRDAQLLKTRVRYAAMIDAALGVPR